MSFDPGLGMVDCHSSSVVAFFEISFLITKPGKVKSHFDFWIYLRFLRV